MRKHYLLLTVILGITFQSTVSAQKTVKVLDQILFYDGYASLEKLADEMVPVPEGVIRHKTSLYATKLTDEQINVFGESITMNITVKAACDNYDRIGNANLAFVPKGQDTYVSNEVEKIEMGRFITPFMNKNNKPDEVPYTYNVDYLKNIFKNEDLVKEYDFWIELEIFGVPYAANTQVWGCKDRNDVFYGSLEFVTTDSPVELEDGNVLIPLFHKHQFNNYNEDATDELGKTVKSVTFSLAKDLTDSQLILITSNHGADSGGEEYNRRWHYVYFDDENVLTYKPGRESCEPFRKYNTQGNFIYGSKPMTDEEWQSFSNWCPGDVIDNRYIRLGALESGNHTFRIEVPDAQFKGKEGKNAGNFPLSLYLLGKENGSLSIQKVDSDIITIVPNDNYSIFSVESNQQIANISVYDLLGHKLSVNNTYVADLTGYPSGIYIFNIILENGYVHTRKVIKR